MDQAVVKYLVSMLEDSKDDFEVEDDNGISFFLDDVLHQTTNPHAIKLTFLPDADSESDDAPSDAVYMLTLTKVSG